MFTLILPALHRPHAEPLPEFNTPVLNKFLRFGQLNRQPLSLSHVYAEYLHIDYSLPENTVYVSPVWQQMGMHSMNLLDGAAVGIQQEEAEALCEGLNEFYRTQAYFSVIRPDLWQLNLPEAPQWHAPPVFDVLGQMDGSVRAEGVGQQKWLQMQTEIQMWLHDHPMNRHRREHQQPPINGVWLWNPPKEAVLPNETSVQLVGTDSVWASNSPLSTTDAPYDLLTWQHLCQDKQIDINHTTLILEDLLMSLYTNDLWLYGETLQQWERRFFAPLWDAIENNRLEHARLITTGEQGGVLLLKRPPFWSIFKPKRVFNGRNW